MLLESLAHAGTNIEAVQESSKYEFFGNYGALLCAPMLCCRPNMHWPPSLPIAMAAASFSLGTSWVQEM